MSTEPTLCIDARMYNHSGIGTYLQMVLPHICKTYKTILLGDPSILSDLSPIAKILPFHIPIYSISEQLAFNKIVPKSDLFWSPHFNVPLLGIKCKKRVVTIHDVYHLAFYKELSIKQKIYARLVMGAAVRNSDKIITVSEFSKDELIRHAGCKSSKIQVIYNGVNQENCDQNSIYVRNKYKLPDAYILFVGNVKPHKNLKTLLRSYLLLKEDIQAKYKVVIVGKRDGFLTGDEELTRWINLTPAIQKSLLFTGFVANEDLNVIYKNASLFIFPSIYEGFGLPPLEAMLNSCPVLASKSSSIPEVCGDAALYFNPFSETDLSEKISLILTNDELRQNLILRGSEQIRLFNWKESAVNHIKAFNELIENI